MADVASEIRICDLKTLIHMIHREDAVGISDIIASSSELFFESGALRYALNANYSIDWNLKPTICVDIEFRNGNVAAFFKLELNEHHPRISLDGAIFGSDNLSDSQKIVSLHRAIRAARRSACMSSQPG
jgi:hypothetical protein